MLIHHSANLDHRFDQLFRRQDITQAQGWIKNLAHCARVDDAASVIEPLQTWKRGTRATKFRVVIVFEKVSVAPARKIDSGRPTCEPHRHAARKLMGSRHGDYLRRS